MEDTIFLTPEKIDTEIQHSLLPSSCGAVTSKAYQDKEVPSLVWLVFGGTGALGRQISKLAIQRRDRVLIAALDEEYDCGLWEPTDSHAKSSTKSNTNTQGYSGLGSKRKFTSDVSDPSNKKRFGYGKTARPSPFLFIREDFKGSCKRVKCDVRIRSSVDNAIKQCIDSFGRIDVVVTCFGYGVVGACEDQVESEVRSQFEVNFMGLFHTLRAVLPHLTNEARERTNAKGISIPGHIISFTSSMGVLGAPGFGPYSATRWAAEGLLESFAIEVEHLGCKVTIIETGYAKAGDKEDDMAVAKP